MKRTSAIAAVTAAALALSLAACGSADSAAASSAPAGDFDADQDITVISREDGSGTRGAFIELTGVEEKNADGKKVDNTTEAAAIQSSTNGVMTAVANDETAIGYISLGSLSNDVKAVTVGGVEASAETVKDGSYVLSRPFNIVTNGDATDPVAVDFIAYCLSKDGQAIATDNGYIGEDGADFTSAQPEGKIVVGGSSSVSPLMEKLIDACRTMTTAEILALPDVKERIEVYNEQTEKFKQMVSQYTRTEGNVIITDLRGVNPIYTGNRFMIYSMYPEQNISAWIVSGRGGMGCSAAVGYSILNRTCDINVGSLMLKYNGGGHKAVGTCQFSDENMETELPKMLEELCELANK